MAGRIGFADGDWDGKSSACCFALDFLAVRLPPGAGRDRIRELADANVLFLDLSGPEEFRAVDLLADALPRHIDGIADEPRRQNLAAMLDALCVAARRQQRRNRASANTPPAPSRPVPIRFDQTGLAGRTAVLLTDLPTDTAGVPVDLPPGTRRVVVLDDTPDPTLTLRVHPVGDERTVAYIDHAELAMEPAADAPPNGPRR
ncbi:MAG: hypothetical protein QM662_12485 [Gordonia sp. (in: high G+C Gram-positive bacteria)]